MNALVTGGAGLLGTALVRELVDRGYSVTVFDRKVPTVSSVRAVVGDLTDPTAVAAVMQGMDVVFHVAGLTPPLRPSTADYYDVNVKGTGLVAESAAGAGVKRLVYTSSVWASGHQPVPLDPGDAFPITEECRRPPQEVYGLTKRLGEEAVALYRGQMTAVALRAASFYPQADPVMRAFALLVGCIELADLVQAEICAAEADIRGYRLYVISGTPPLDPAEVLAHGLRAVVERKLPRFAAMCAEKNIALPERVDWFDTSRARREIGFRPQINFADLWKE